MIDTTSRRAMLAGFAGSLAVPAIAAIPMRTAAPNPLDVARHSADLLAAQMQELHGGIWFAHVDHASGFILIRPKYSEETKALLKAGAS